MKQLYLLLLFIGFTVNSMAQVVISPKGTKILIDSSKWMLSGNNIFNKNPGNIGIGTTSPTAKLHLSGDLRLQGIGTTTSNTKILTTDVDGYVTTRTLSNFLSGNAITSLNGLTNSLQTFATGTSGTDFTIASLGSVHTFNLPTASAVNRGALSSADWSTFNGKENALTFSTGLTRNANTITVNTSQQINTLSNLTSNGLIKTTGGTGALSIATAGTDYSAGTSSLGTGLLKSTTGTGALTIAVASDFPVLNQNTTGNAATVTTNANLNGDVTSIGNTTTITTGIVSNSKLANMAANSFKGNNTGSAAVPLDLTATQATAMLDNFTSTLKGLTPLSGGGIINFLRADGTWAVPPGNEGTVSSVSIESANGLGGTVNNPTTTPNIILSTNVNGMVMGDGNAFSAATAGVDYSAGTALLPSGILKSTTVSGNLGIALPNDFPTLNQNTTGNAATSGTSTNGTITDDNLTNASVRLIWAAGTGSQGLKSSSSKLTFNPFTGTLVSSVFSGSGSLLTNIPNTATTATSLNTPLTIVSRDASGNFSAGTITASTFNGNFIGNASTVTTNANLTGPVTSIGNATSITTNAITNSMLSQVATQTLKGRTSAGSGNVEDLTISQVKSLLNLAGNNSGDQTITLTGDVTGTGTGSFTTTIGPETVTYSKIQNVSASNKVLGRTSSGAGIVEEISTTGSGNVVRSVSPTLQTPIGLVKSDVGLGNADNTSDLAKPVSTATQAALNLKISASEKAANNGVATLDAGGKIPASQLPVGSQVYKGTWNASTNTPTLADGTGTTGWTYRVTTGGTINLGSGSLTFAVGDDAIYNGTVWQRNPSSATVTSVNAQTGTVVLTTDNINEGLVNKYYSDSLARSSLSVTSPLVYSSATGALSIPQATTSASGYLSSADWNTFNSKQASGNFITSLSGDITATGPGNVQATIAANAVTYNKMQAMTANRLLGSGLTGTSVGEITLGTGLSFLGNTLNAANSGGTLTNISLVSANGFTGSIVNPTTSPAITLNTSITGMLKGSGGALTAATAGTDYSAGTSSLATGLLKSTTGTGTLSIAVASDFPILNQNTTGNAATVTTNANLTGPVTSIGNTTDISANVITNAMLSQVATQTFKGRTTAGTGDAEDLTSTQATAMLNTFTSSSKGLVPASGGGTSTFLRADGTFATPPSGSGSGYRTLVTTSADVINNNSNSNTLADVTGLSFSVVAGTVYRFYAIIPYTSAASSTGSRWTINAPAATLLNYTSRYMSSTTGQTQNYLSAVNQPSSASNGSLVNGNLAIIEGIIKPSANGTLQIRFASEVAGSAITAKAGASLEYW